MGWGFLEKIVDTVHDATKYLDPVGHYSLDAAHDSSTALVNETSRAIENAFGKDTFLGGLGEHWKNMSQKDKDDFGRWLTNTGLSAAAIYGGMNAVGGSSASSGAAGEAGAAGGGMLGSGAGGVASGGAGAGGITTGAAGAGAVGTGATTGAGAAAGAGGTSWGSLAGQGLSSLGSLYQAYQSQKAADALAASGDAANATQRYIFDTLNAQQIPYRELGYRAIGNINGLMNDPSSVTSDPGYQFGLKEGMRAVDNSASARGGIGGAALKAGSRYATDYATTKLNDVYNRNFTAAGLGQVSNGQSGISGMNYGNNVANTQLGVGNALAANYLNQGNIWGNALNGLGAYMSRGG